MSAISAFNVYDGAGTPLLHTFTPEDVKTISATRQVASWKEVIANVPEYALNRVLLSKDVLGNGVIRAAVRFQIPYMESVSGANSAGYTAPPKVAYIDQMDVVIHVNPRSVSQGRLNNQSMVRNFLGNVQTTVAAPGSGFAYDLLTGLIMPT